MSKFSYWDLKVRQFLYGAKVTAKRCHDRVPFGVWQTGADAARMQGRVSA